MFEPKSDQSYRDLCRDAQTTAEQYRSLGIAGVLLVIGGLFAVVFLRGQFQLFQASGAVVQKALEVSR